MRERISRESTAGSYTIRAHLLIHKLIEFACSICVYYERQNERIASRLQSVRFRYIALESRIYHVQIISTIIFKLLT